MEAELRLVTQWSNTGGVYRRMKMTTLQELLDQKASLDRQIAEAQRTSRANAISQIRALMADHGLTSIDISSVPVGKKAAKTAGKKVAAKYRDPESGATWSGRGLKPKWLTEALAMGRSISEFGV